jgi:putative transposase
MTWVILSKLWSGWKSSLMLVKPETVISWHRKTFKFYWLWRSKRGRPKISLATIALIKRLHRENPLWSPERIHNQLIVLGVTDAPAPNTIAKYFPATRKPPSEKRQQSWNVFLANHRQGIWSMDFLVVPTLRFQLLYVLLIMSHDRRKIEHVAVTANPSSLWVAHQLREATPFGGIPDYLIHDNDSIFTAKSLQEFLVSSKIKSKRTCFHSPRQNGICERTIGILRRELLDHLIPFNQKHLEFLLQEFIQCYYNPVRTHQGINRQSPVFSGKPPETSIADTVLVSEPILGGLYHSYRKAS